MDQNTTQANKLALKYLVSGTIKILFFSTPVIENVFITENLKKVFTLMTAENHTEARDVLIHLRSEFSEKKLLYFFNNIFSTLSLGELNNIPRSSRPVTAVYLDQEMREFLSQTTLYVTYDLFKDLVTLSETVHNISGLAYEVLLTILNFFKSLENDEPEKIRKIREEVEYVFLIKMYLKGDEDLPERMSDHFDYAMLSEFLKKEDLAVLKSLADSFTRKTMTASGNVAQSIEKEDLKPRRKKYDEKDDNTIQRIEKLDETNIFNKPKTVKSITNNDLQNNKELKNDQIQQEEPINTPITGEIQENNQTQIPDENSTINNITQDNQYTPDEVQADGTDNNVLPGQETLLPTLQPEEVLPGLVVDQTATNFAEPSSQITEEQSQNTSIDPMDDLLARIDEMERKSKERQALESKAKEDFLSQFDLSSPEFTATRRQTKKVKATPIPRVLPSDNVSKTIEKYVRENTNGSNEPLRDFLAGTDDIIRSVYGEVLKRAGKSSIDFANPDTLNEETSLLGFDEALDKWRGFINFEPEKRLALQAFVAAIDQGILDPKERESFLEKTIVELYESLPQTSEGYRVDTFSKQQLSQNRLQEMQELAKTYLYMYDTRLASSAALKERFGLDPNTDSWDLHRSVGANFGDVRQILDLWFSDNPERVAPLSWSLSSWTSIPSAAPTNRTTKQSGVLEYLTKEDFGIAYRAQIPNHRVLIDYIHSGSNWLDSSTGFRVNGRGTNVKLDPNLCEFVVMNSENEPITSDPRDCAIYAFGRYYTYKDRDRLYEDMENFERLKKAAEEVSPNDPVETEKGRFEMSIFGVRNYNSQNFPLDDDNFQTSMILIQRAKAAKAKLQEYIDPISEELGVDIFDLFKLKFDPGKNFNVEEDSIYLESPVARSQFYFTLPLDTVSMRQLEIMKKHINALRKEIPILISEIEIKWPFSHLDPNDQLDFITTRLAKQLGAYGREDLLRKFIQKFNLFTSRQVKND